MAELPQSPRQIVTARGHSGRHRILISTRQTCAVRHAGFPRPPRLVRPAAISVEGRGTAVQTGRTLRRVRARRARPLTDRSCSRRQGSASGGIRNGCLQIVRGDRLVFGVSDGHGRRAVRRGWHRRLDGSPARLAVSSNFSAAFAAARARGTLYLDRPGTGGMRARTRTIVCVVAWAAHWLSIACGKPTVRMSSAKLLM
jgi:hypothetical protein